MITYNFLPGFLRSSTTRCFFTSKDTGCITPAHRSSKESQRFYNRDSSRFPIVSTDDAWKVLLRFEKDRNMREEAHMHGITKTLFHRSIKKFKRICLNKGSSGFSYQLQGILHGIACQKYPISALLPFFLEHSHQVFPAVRNRSKMKQLSDLSEPALWYPKARAMSRKIVFHAGPTNSGKTHAALERFYDLKRAVYCSPLRLLAREICEKSRIKGVPCDMITGDDQDFTSGKSSKRANKLACTVEMTDLNKCYDVAVIDEIQMLSDVERGWAWTRAFLGIRATEVHVCGEERALEIVNALADECCDELTVHEYKRLGLLRVKKNPVECLSKLKPGDCIVCFKKEQIYSYKKRLAEEGIEAAIIYGDLPPVTKLEEAKKFNDPDHPCNVLVTTDAIGMGLNLNIKRIIFNDIKKTTTTEHGHKKVAELTPSQVLQISGRSGRFGSQYPDGSVTAMHHAHQEILLNLLKSKAKAIKHAGIHPSFERLQLFAKEMKSSSLHDVLSVFISMCETDRSLYFLCTLKECQDIAEALSDVKLSLHDIPVSIKRDFVVAALKVYAEFYSRGLVATQSVIKKMLDWPPPFARNKHELSHLEDIYECLRLYLWLR